MEFTTFFSLARKSHYEAVGGTQAKSANFSTKAAFRGLTSRSCFSSLVKPLYAGQYFSETIGTLYTRHVYRGIGEWGDRRPFSTSNFSNDSSIRTVSKMPIFSQKLLVSRAKTSVLPTNHMNRSLFKMGILQPTRQYMQTGVPPIEPPENNSSETEGAGKDKSCHRLAIVSKIAL